MKLCIDCKWVESTGPNYICGKKTPVSFNPVTVVRYEDLALCSSLREIGALEDYNGCACGPDGLWWEPKSSSTTNYDYTKPSKDVWY